MDVTVPLPFITNTLLTLSPNQNTIWALFRLPPESELPPNYSHGSQLKLIAFILNGPYIFKFTKWQRVTAILGRSHQRVLSWGEI